MFIIGTFRTFVVVIVQFVILERGFQDGYFRVAIFRNAVFRNEVFGLRFLEFAFHRQCRQGNLWGRQSIIIDCSSDYLLNS